MLFPGTTGDQPRTARLLQPFRCTERRCCASDLSARALDSKPGLLQDLLCPTQSSFVSRPESCLRIPWAPRGLHEPSPDVSAVREPSQWPLSPRSPQGVGNNDAERGRSAALPRLEPRAKCRLGRSGKGGQSSVCFAFLNGVPDVCCNRHGGSPIDTTHRFFHRCYAHSYPQTVGDLSQARAAALDRERRTRPSPPSERW